jgi:hypothetical protein
MKRIGHPKDFWSGLLFVGIGAFAGTSRGSSAS